jgi:hypothetical protein
MTDCTSAISPAVLGKLSAPMVLAGVIGICVLGAGVLAIYLRRMRVAAPTSFPPVFNVVALGANGTGKTVLLASMFNRFRTNVQPGGLRLRMTDGEQANRLTRVWTQVDDSSAGWPPANNTGVVETFAFECMGSVAGDEYPVLGFNYVDYAGEAISGHDAAAGGEAQGKTTADLIAKLKTAHAVFGIFDGRRIAEYLAGAPEGVKYLKHVILPMVDRMRDAKCPIHLIVTQWDVLAPNEADDPEKFGAVLDALRAQKSISNLFQLCKARKQKVRLIPVSAVGRTFAHPDDTGDMIKCPDGVLQPLNVEFPLCAIVPDLFTQVDANLSEDLRTQITDELGRQQRIRRPRRAATALNRFVNSPAGLALGGAVSLTVGMNIFTDRLAAMFLDWLAQRERMRRNTRAEGPHGMARQAVIQEFAEQMIVLKFRYSGSDLTGTGQ